MAVSDLAERLNRLRSQAGNSAGIGGVAQLPHAQPDPDAAAIDVATRQRDAGLRALLRRQLQKSTSARPEPSPESGPHSTPEMRAADQTVGEARMDSGAAVEHARPRQGKAKPCIEPASESALLDAGAAEPAAARGMELAPGLFEHLEQLACAPPPPWLRLPDVSAPLLPTDALLHFDTETTGLAGGAGTRAFMLGFARWNAAGLELRQLWITRLGAEPAMLERFAQWLSASAFQLVSYNGGSFDAPLLAARYRLCRMRDPLKGLPHHDLLYAVRRRFRGEWPSCRLGEAERRLLGVERVDDLPGALAPAAFLSALRQGQMGPLQRVQAHHRQDLISLAGLLPSLCQLASQAPPDWALRSPRQACAHA